jgi:ribosomal protein L6P/L9E
MWLGFYKNYFYFLKLKGMGFRVLGHSKGLVFKLGCSHKILFLKKIDTVFFYLARLIFIIKSRCILTLKNILSTILTFKKRNSYKKKGIFYKGVVIKVKLTSKKSKF